VLGQCATVGVVGLTLGGGLGWLSGKHGAACDNLLSAELVTADGRNLRTSATEHPDLFWAIRGGGGNYGIVTSLTYQLHPIGDVISGDLSYRFSDARSVVEVFGDFMAVAPDALQATLTLVRESQSVISIRVCWSGDPRDAGAIIKPLRTTVKPVTDTVRRGTLMDSFVATEGPTPFGICKGLYLQSLSGNAVDTILDRFAQAPGPVAMIGLDHYMHGQVCRVKPDSTAFELRARDAVHVWVEAIGENTANEASLSRWVGQTWTALRTYSGGRVYANYPAAETESAVREVYQENYSRLVAVKTQYDPKNVFQRNHNVRPRTG
jgi:FAD/FMN-containing dehydrogenase